MCRILIRSIKAEKIIFFLEACERTPSKLLSVRNYFQPGNVNVLRILGFDIDTRGHHVRRHKITSDILINNENINFTLATNVYSKVCINKLFLTFINLTNRRFYQNCSIPSTQIKFR